jgi:hypothetical protein
MRQTTKIPVVQLLAALQAFQKAESAKFEAVAAPPPPKAVANLPAAVAPQQQEKSVIGESAAVAAANANASNAAANRSGGTAAFAAAPGLEKPSATGASAAVATPSPPTSISISMQSAPESGEAARSLEGVTWETEIAQLQANHDEYVKKSMWTVADDADKWPDLGLGSFEPIPLNPPVLKRKKPGFYQEIVVDPGASSSADRVNASVAASSKPYSVPPGPPSEPPPKAPGEGGDLEDAPPGLPPKQMSPPPPPPIPDGGFEGFPPLQAANLPSKAKSAGKGHADPKSPADKDSAKECKQQ